MMTKMGCPLVEGKFCEEHGKALKPAIVQDYSRHTGYVDKSDRMTENYSIFRWTWKWTKKEYFFHLLDLTILHNFMLPGLLIRRNARGWKGAPVQNHPKGSTHPSGQPAGYAR
jgi:hypothetical protein